MEQGEERHRCPQPGPAVASSHPILASSRCSCLFLPVPACSCPLLPAPGPASPIPPTAEPCSQLGGGHPITRTRGTQGRGWHLPPRKARGTWMESRFLDPRLAAPSRGSWVRLGDWLGPSAGGSQASPTRRDPRDLMLNEQKIMECIKITQEPGKGWGGEGVTCNQRWARPPACSSTASTAKPGQLQPRRVGGRGGVVCTPTVGTAPSWAGGVRPSQRGSIPTHQCHPAGTVSKPTAGG